jgi:hypothetical protein
MSTETRKSHLVKKTGVKKSRWTVPLSNKRFKINVCLKKVSGVYLVKYF